MTVSTSTTFDVLERRVARTTAARDVQKLIARYFYLFGAARFDEAAELFDLADAQVRLELAPGDTAQGSDAVRAAIVRAGAAGPGALREISLSTPFVNVSPDATTATGVWMALGAFSTPRPDGAPTAEWTWSQLEVAFVHTDAGWRVRSLRVAPRFTTPFDQDWSSTARKAQAAGAPLPGYAPDRVATLDPQLPEKVQFEVLSSEDLADPEVAAIDRRVSALEDAWAIENLMSAHEYLHAGNLNGVEFETCFAHQLDDVAFEPEDWGVWDGPRAIKACYVDGAPPAMPGILTEHATSTGVVEIAEDGKTARGVWISPGHEAFAAPDGNDRVVWSWGRYGVDFAKIDGQWRFWRFHIYTTFRTEFDTSWVDSAVAPRTLVFAEGEVPPGMEPPSRPITANAPYHPERAPQLLPEPPAPYRSWDEAHTYIPLPGA